MCCHFHLPSVYDVPNKKMALPWSKMMNEVLENANAIPTLFEKLDQEE